MRNETRAYVNVLCIIYIVDKKGNHLTSEGWLDLRVACEITACMYMLCLQYVGNRDILHPMHRVSDSV